MLEAWFNSSTVEVPEVTRGATEQARVDAETADLALYHYDSCMFCARVRKAIAALNLDIELRDVMHDRTHYRELAAGGGRTTVPCLRIGKDREDAQWMYESADIVGYLVERFGGGAA